MFKHIASTIVLLGLLAAPARATEQLCDPAFENCRVPLMTLIQNETVGIDAAFWFMEDWRYADALIAKHRAGVQVRLIVDLRANSSYSLNGPILEKLAAAGIPMRRAGDRWLHWKMMLFARQNVVEFSGANYSPNAFVPEVPYSNYIDEVVYFTDDLDTVNSFKTRFDDLWTGSSYVNYANITSLTRNYPTYSRDPDMNFVPLENYALRMVKHHNAETRQIDITMYRITDRRHTDALIAARQRGVRVRLLTEPAEYRNPKRLWHSWNVDRLYMAGVEIMHRAHQGLNHQKSVQFHSLGLSVIGSSNWTSGSAGSSDEHNYFTSKPWIFDWLTVQFERKWNNSTGIIEYQPFQPLPPTRPVLVSPANFAVGQSTTQTLVWNGGPYAHTYDVYFGTTPDPPLLAGNVALGPSESTASSQNKKFALPSLAPGTTYYWRIVGRTMADMLKSTAVSSFTTAGTAEPGPVNGGLGPGDVNLYAKDARIPSGSRWAVIGDATAAGGARIGHPNANAAKLSTALAEPTNYFELTFTAEQGRPYRLWIRGRAESNYWANDSVYVQFSGSVTDAGATIYRIGTTSGADVNLEDCSGCGLSGWGWQDNGWGTGVLGPVIYFQTTGVQTIRVQTREDGFSIDQILLSPERYLNSSPGSAKSDSTIFPQTSGS